MDRMATVEIEFNADGRGLSVKDSRPAPAAPSAPPPAAAAMRTSGH
jgi:hypothetical protein